MKDEIIKKAREYYKIPGNECGGLLHIVLDDGNMDDGSIQFCLNECVENGDKDGEEIATMLLGLPEEERDEIYLELCT